MESQKIKILLERYWAGEANLAEEQTLKAYFKGEVPKELAGFQPLFDYAAAVEATEQPFDLNFLEEHARKESYHLPSWNKWWQPAIGVAAAVLIIFGSVFSQWDAIENPVVAEKKEVKSAYEETLAALAFLSDKLNEGNASIYELGAFDAATKQIINEKN